MRSIDVAGWLSVYIQALDGYDNPVSERQSQDLFIASGVLGGIAIAINVTWEISLCPSMFVYGGVQNNILAW